MVWITTAMVMSMRKLAGGTGYTAPDQTVQYLGETCGLGACEGGTVVCSETGLGWSAQVTPTRARDLRRDRQ